MRLIVNLDIELGLEIWTGYVKDPSIGLRKLHRHGPGYYLQQKKDMGLYESSPNPSRSYPLLKGELTYDFRAIVSMAYRDQWRELRKMWVAQLFSPKRVPSFWPIREVEAERMMGSITFFPSCGHNCLVNVSEEVHLLFNNFMGRALLGKSYYV